jgi:putative transposase
VFDTINGRKHWLWRAVDQHGAVLDVLAKPANRHVARRPIPQGDFLRDVRKLLRKHGRAPRVLLPTSSGATRRRTGISV